MCMHVVILSIKAKGLLQVLEKKILKKKRGGGGGVSYIGLVAILIM